MSEHLVPDGFEPHFRSSRLSDPWEPIYSQKLEDRLQICFVRTLVRADGSAVTMANATVKIL